MKGDRVIATLVVFAIGVPLLFAAYALLARFGLHGEVTARSLARAVVRENGVAGSASCRREEADLWRCTTYDPSGTARAYRVRITDGSCWEARRVRAPRSEPSFDGCVYRWQWSLL